MARDTDDEDTKQAIYNVDVDISVVLGQANLRVNQLLKLGRGAVVGAGSLVRTEVPPMVVAGGNPLRIIRER